ncbi:hypothetical protein [Chryseobacterium sp.]|uniref:hypothetical protein n=1 Tax=Chryseobacterium sp. TaxID=1871047 RepID=UPI00261BFB13|nr:hypothetical protein [Chryseobacterium sp.]
MNKSTKTLKYFIIPLLCIAVMSCSGHKKKGCEHHSEVQNSIQTEPFNLSALPMGENINTILKSAGAMAASDTVKADEMTLIGNDRLAFSSEKLLHFNGISLDGKNSKNTNKVVFHYGNVDPKIGPVANEKNDKLGMYQLDIYTEKEQKALFENLNKTLHTPVFDTIHNNFESKITGNEIAGTPNKFRQEVAIWKSKNLTYYYYETEMENKSDELRCNLFVFKDKEWKEFLESSGYPDADKIFLK